MDCRTFRDRHTLYIDGQCSALVSQAMRSHAHACRSCGRHDAVVRRGRLLLRNLPRIEPSPGFRVRLVARLDEAGVHARRWPDPPALPRLGRYASLAAALVLLSVIAARMVADGRRAVYRLPPVVASAPPSEPSPFGSPALVATVPSGMSIWPAIVMASHAPAHFVAAELAAER